MRYKNISGGQWVNTPWNGLTVACCDCGLVHLYRFKVVGKRLYRAVWRSDKRTAGVRRGKAYSGLRLPRAKK